MYKTVAGKTKLGTQIEGGTNRARTSSFTFVTVWHFSANLNSHGSRPTERQLKGRDINRTSHSKISWRHMPNADIAMFLYHFKLVHKYQNDIPVDIVELQIKMLQKHFCIQHHRNTRKS